MRSRFLQLRSTFLPLALGALLSALAGGCASGDFIGIELDAGGDLADDSRDVGVVPRPDTGGRDTVDEEGDAQSDTTDVADVATDAPTDTSDDTEDAETDASDGSGDGSGDLNEPPVIVLAETFRGVVDTSMTFDASDCFDPDGDELRYSWTFGDGSTAAGVTIPRVFEAAGTFRGSLRVLDTSDATDTAEFTVIIDPKAGDPVAVISFAADHTLPGEEAAMHGRLSTSPGADITTWQWAITDPDGATTNLEGAAIAPVLDTPGYHSVRLTVVDSLDRTGAVVQPYRVAGPPEAAIRIITARPTVGIPMVATADPTTDPDDNIVDFRWTLPDGTVVSTGTDPVVEFEVDAVGLHDVAVDVTDADLLTDSASLRFEVFGDGSSNTPPVVEAGDDRTAFRGATLSLLASAADADGTIAEVAWDFGDGGVAPGTTVDHAWAADGVYVVRVRATDNEGAAAVDSFRVTVTRPANPPVPVIRITPPSPAPGTSATLDGSATTDPDSDAIVEYRWDFGDGSATGFGVTTSHSYAASGTFTVRLDVTDATGSTAFTTQSVTVACGVDCYDGTFRVLPLGDDLDAEGYCNSNFNIILSPVNCGVDIVGGSMTLTCGADTYRGTIDVAGNFDLTVDYRALDTGWCGPGYFDERLRGSFTGSDAFRATSNLAFILEFIDPFEDCVSCSFDPFLKTGRRL